MSLVPVSGRIACSPIAWVSSGRHVVVPFGRVLHVLDITEPKPKCVAYLRGHSAPVVSVVAAGNMRVASASEDGTVRFWDVDDGSCLRTVDVGQKLYHMCCAAQDSYLCLTATRVLRLFPAKKGKSRLQTLFSDRQLDGKEARIASSTDGAIVAAVDKHLLLITSCSEPFRPVVTIRHYSWLTAVAVSSDGSFLAVGDEKGAIFVYPNPSSVMPKSNKTVRLNRSQTVSSVLHWHSSPVQALVFSSDANFLFSGATEATVVTWKMTKNRFGEKTFLPRLRSCIHAISLCADDSMYALTQGDNSVRLINASSSSLHTVIRGIGGSEFERSVQASDAGNFKETSNCLQARRYPLQPGWIAVFGTGAVVQLFDIRTGLHVSDQVLVPRNLVSKPGAQKQSSGAGSVQVAAIEFSSCGTKMASVDTQRLSLHTSDEFGIEDPIISLRFWNVDGTGNTFSLSTVCTQPHGRNGTIEDICFHPRLAVAATASSNGTFRLWREVLRSQKTAQFSWRSEVELNYKNQSCNSICFSNDGSLLGVACGSALTIWSVEDLLDTHHQENDEVSDADTHPGFFSPSSLKVTFLHALVHPPTEEKILSVSFLQTEVPLFVTATSTGVYVWNALTQGVWWSSRMRNLPRVLTVDSSTGRFAIATEIPAICEAHSGGREEDQDQADGNNQNEAEPNAVQSKKESSEIGLNSSTTARSQVKKRPRSDHKEAKTSEQFASNQKNRSPSDWAIALFDAQSPVPLRICRLDTGIVIRSLEFVPQSLNNSDTPKLVCIDSSLGVSILKVNEADTEPSVSTNPSLSLFTDSKESDNKVESFLGLEDIAPSSVPDEGESKIPGEPQDWSTFHDLEGSSLDVRSAFREHFEGPIHSQPPIVDTALAFMKQLLPKVERKSDQDTSYDTDSPFDYAKNVSREGHGNEQEENNHKPLTMEEYEECRVFCSRLVKSHFRDVKTTN